MDFRPRTIRNVGERHFLIAGHEIECLVGLVRPKSPSSGEVMMVTLEENLRFD